MDCNATPRTAEAPLRATQVVGGVKWLGGAQSLVAAGLCAAEQLPGLPGSKSSKSATFFDGYTRRPRTIAERVQSMKRVERIGDKFTLFASNAHVLTIARRDQQFLRFLAGLHEPRDTEGEAV